MELTNEFRVPVPVDEAWGVLTDIERIAPCMPGAQLEDVTGDEYRGVVKVKVGPITAQYKGVARFLERDDAAHRAVLKAEGRETRGQGNANATVTAQLAADGDGTTVSVVTDLTVTGRVAQFGRGVMVDVSSKLLTQFAECLEQELSDGEAAAGDGTGTATPQAAERSKTTEAEPVDLLEAAGAPVARRVVPIAAIVIAVLWLTRIFVRRRRRR
jgi:carbon monoxide dehydrogenase subunit G